MDKPLGLGEWLRSLSPEEYESMLERVAQRAAQAQWRLMAMRRAQPQSGPQSESVK